MAEKLNLKKLAFIGGGAMGEAIIKGITGAGLIDPAMVCVGAHRKERADYLHETYGDAIYISIMNQYTPLPQVTHVSELNRRVTAEEYDRVLRFAERLNIQNGFIQEGEAAKDSFIPEFDCRGL